jgi:hypothetical protein
MPSKTFPRSVLAAIDESRILGIRAGDEHRFTGIWVVVVGGRVFVRPWNDKRTGWHRAFEDDPVGAIQVGAREIKVRAKATRSERLMDAVDAAYAKKYHTPASRKYVRGFSQVGRRATTTELVPR